MNWNEIWQSIKTFFASNGWAIFGFFVTLVLGYILIKLVIKLFRSILAKSKMDKIAQKFLLNILKVLLFLLYIIILLSQIGVSVTGIVAALSAAVLAIGLALQNSLSNLANGIIIVTNKQFREGDYIEVDGVEGTVKNINLLATTVITPDNKAITIPNSHVINNPMVNYDAEQTRRIDFLLELAYETDLEKAKKVILSVIESDGRIYLDPPPACRLKTISPSLAVFVTFWVDNEDYWDVYYSFLGNVFNEFKKNSIMAAFDQLIVSVKDKKVLPFDESPLPPRKEKLREKEKKSGLFEFDLEQFKKRKKRKHAKSLDKNDQKVNNKTSE